MVTTIELTGSAYRSSGKVEVKYSNRDNISFGTH